MLEVILIPLVIGMFLSVNMGASGIAPASSAAYGVSYPKRPDPGPFRCICLPRCDFWGESCFRDNRQRVSCPGAFHANGDGCVRLAQRGDKCLFTSSTSGEPCTNILSQAIKVTEHELGQRLLHR